MLLHNHSRHCHSAAQINIYMNSVRWPVTTASLLCNIRLLQNLHDLYPSAEAHFCGWRHLLLLPLSFKMLSQHLDRLLFKLLYNSTELVGCCWSMYEIAALKFTHMELNPLLHRLNSNMNYILCYYGEKHYRFIKLLINLSCCLQ